jgi:hypothetical protein
MLISLGCLLRGLPMFFRAVPKTPLRVLCIIAFDTLHALRKCGTLPHRRREDLATLLDFGASANASLDGKKHCVRSFEENQQRLHDAGLGRLVNDYVSQLQWLESQRPSPGGDHRTFVEVRAYRESVARLSLGIIAVTALGREPQLPARISIHGDEGLDLLFRIVMQCQIIDDVLDYAKDVSAGLPGFLTASTSLPEALKWTALAAEDYSECRQLAGSAELFPLRMALNAVSAVTRLILRTRRWHCRILPVDGHADNQEEFSAV